MSEPKPRLSLTYLSTEDKEQIYAAALRILEEIGMVILQDEALGLLKQAGCPADENRKVRIFPGLVEKALAGTPKSVAVFNRNGDPAMDLGGYRSYFGTGSDLIYAHDAKSMSRRKCVLDDIGRAARVCDALEQIDFVMSFAHPSDVAAGRAYLESFAAMAENTVKPIVCTAEGREDLARIWEIASMLRGGDEALRQKPYFIHYAEPVTPLKHPVKSLDKLLLCAQKAIPVVYSPAPIAGSTAPMTIAGHVALGISECLCGLVIHQLKAPGAPFIMGMGPAVLDMATGQCSYNAPEYYMAYLAIIEIARFLDLPCWGYAATSDSQIPDGQATYEAGLCTFLSFTAGANLNHDVGYLDFGRTGSLEMIVAANEMIGQMRHMGKGIPVDAETLAVDVLKELGPGGNFLMHPHTLRHFADVQWRPRLISRTGYDKWQKDGALSLFDRCRNRVTEILENHRPAPIPETRARRIRELAESYPG